MAGYRPLFSLTLETAMDGEILAQSRKAAKRWGETSAYFPGE
jgi:hypothetical protein